MAEKEMADWVQISCQPPFWRQCFPRAFPPEGTGEKSDTRRRARSCVEDRHTGSAQDQKRIRRSRPHQEEVRGMECQGSSCQGRVPGPCSQGFG